ncbi:hypothetical protein [Azospirillum sp. B510]|uniref:hypothetical protein n=1 Tax=Azospirillum sp. (strain B510) TaxID=137722 RepID=UPI0020004942|nr:hypothetical protein [Azospirillum sp. B510]
MADQTLAEPTAADETNSIPASTKARLRQILNGNSRHSAGAIQLIGLDALRIQLGSRWNSVKARVHDQAERLLNRHLPPSDVWLRADEANYLIVFATLDRQSAELICGRVVSELHRLMLGNNDTGSITVRSVVTEFDGNIAVEEASFDQLIAKALQQGIATSTSIEPETVDHHRDVTVPQEVESFHPNICFRPVFDVAHKVLSTYVCHLDDGTKRTLSAFPADDLRGEEYRFLADSAILMQSVEIHGDLHKNNFRYIQNLVIHFSTISIARYRRDYIALCHSIPVHLVPFMVFVLHGVPMGVPYGRIAEIMTVLKPYARAVLVLFDDGAPNLAAFAQAGVRGLGIIVQPGEPEARAATRVHNFGTHVRRHGMVFFVDGIRTATMLRVAEEAGASYVAGPLVGTDTDVPGHMKRVTERELIQRSARMTRHF